MKKKGLIIGGCVAAASAIAGVVAFKNKDKLKGKKKEEVKEKKSK